MKQMKVLVDVFQACDDDTIPGADIVRNWVVLTARAAGHSSDVDVSVRIVNAEESRALNKEYRGKDWPTNVLSFPAGRIEGLPNDVPVQLGDIVVCASVVSDEADEQDKAVADHWAHMIVHGTLHLMGYDHQTDAEAAEMEALETRILMKSGLKDPYLAPGQNC
jgi:probable rRNA maturation factor